MRLFLVSGLVWILGRFWQNDSGMPAAGAYWIAISSWLLCYLVWDTCPPPEVSHH